MSFLIHLENILLKIDKMLLSQGFSETEIHSEGFRVLGELYLISSLERAQIIETNLSLISKQNLLVDSFPSVLSGTLGEAFESIYAEMLKFRKKYGITTQRDIVGSFYQRILTSAYIQDKGVVFSPLPIVKYIVSQIEFHNEIFKKNIYKNNKSNPWISRQAFKTHILLQTMGAFL